MYFTFAEHITDSLYTVRTDTNKKMQRIIDIWRLDFLN